MDGNSLKELALTIQRAQKSVGAFSTIRGNHIYVLKASAFAKHHAEQAEIIAKRIKGQPDPASPPSPTLTPTNADLAEATRKAIEATQIHVNAKIAQGDFDFTLGQTGQEIAHVKITRELESNGDVKKQNKIKVEIGDKFSKDLNHINLCVDKEEQIYAQIELSSTVGADTISGNDIESEIKYFKKSTNGSFEEIKRESSIYSYSKIIAKTEITIKTKSDNEEKTFVGRDEKPESKSSWSCCRGKKSENVIDLGVLKREINSHVKLWKIDNDIVQAPTSSAPTFIRSIAIKNEGDKFTLCKTPNENNNNNGNDLLKAYLKESNSKIKLNLEDNGSLYKIEIDKTGKISVIEKTKLKVASVGGAFDGAREGRGR